MPPAATAPSTFSPSILSRNFDSDCAFTICYIYFPRETRGIQLNLSSFDSSAPSVGGCFLPILPLSSFTFTSSAVSTKPDLSVMQLNLILFGPGSLFVLVVAAPHEKKNIASYRNVGIDLVGLPSQSPCIDTKTDKHDISSCLNLGQIYICGASPIRLFPWTALRGVAKIKRSLHFYTEPGDVAGLEPHSPHDGCPRSGPIDTEPGLLPPVRLAWCFVWHVPFPRKEPHGNANNAWSKDAEVAFRLTPTASFTLEANTSSANNMLPNSPVSKCIRLAYGRTLISRPVSSFSDGIYLEDNINYSLNWTTLMLGMKGAELGEDPLILIEDYGWQRDRKLCGASRNSTPSDIFTEILIPFKKALEYRVFFSSLQSENDRDVKPSLEEREMTDPIPYLSFCLTPFRLVPSSPVGGCIPSAVTHPAGIIKIETDLPLSLLESMLPTPVRHTHHPRIRPMQDHTLGTLHIDSIAATALLAEDATFDRLLDLGCEDAGGIALLLQIQVNALIDLPQRDGTAIAIQGVADGRWSLGLISEESVGEAHFAVLFTLWIEGELKFESWEVLLRWRLKVRLRFVRMKKRVSDRSGEKNANPDLFRSISKDLYNALPPTKEVPDPRSQGEIHKGSLSHKKPFHSPRNCPQVGDIQTRQGFIHTQDYNSIVIAFIGNRNLARIRFGEVCAFFEEQRESGGMQGVDMVSDANAVDMWEAKWRDPSHIPYYPQNVAIFSLPQNQLGFNLQNPS
ncbi:uncharacterized protein BDR25DRAFT_354450 [Lindgomyces ingoldianus]|uniref:Uncharacterized protein n=1 Tax=Lindgomyces ingoldianus TaxID=673940 RepID=A0ACB6QWE0_9PLEO|nr:uncharacterized protein BDR25DRAFT_354450 [Lindgomyces ingoldianus]KAF2471191.1 hypothetical protein BDR25DRAFT_354450 [Lindgomyces ingoldianus]